MSHARRSRRLPLIAALAAGTLIGTLAAAPGATALTRPTARTVVTPRATAKTTVLFDDTSAETAGNADWIISTSMPNPLSQNADPQQETDWTGAYSSWGVALQQTGQYSLETLPAGNTITYGDSANALDLSHFDEFVLPEPNIRLTTAEKTALMDFVHAGGGLFLVSDHKGSDRNNDGWDSPQIINDLLTDNGVDDNDPFGFSVDELDLDTDNPVAIQDSSNQVLNGPFGKVTGSILRSGTTFTLNPSDNPNVKGLLYLSTATPGGDDSAFFVTSTYGAGRVAVIGDSSPFDDGTGESGKSLDDGWNDPEGTDAALALNATAWLAGGATGTSGVTVADPGNQTGTVGTAASLPISASDTDGGALSYSATGLPPGLSINASSGLISGTPTTAGTYTPTVTATDATGPTGSTGFTWTVTTAGGGGCSAGQLLGNPGFESGTPSPWTANDSKILYDGSKEPAHSGSWDAWLDGYGTTHTDVLSQTVTIPAGCTAQLGFWLHIDTAETSTTKAYDTLSVQLLNSSGGVLSTLATYSNLNKASGYTQRSFNVSADAGQTVTLRFTGTEDSEDQTSFVVDDTSLAVS